MAKAQTQPDTSAELNQLSQEATDEIELRVAEAVANTKAEMEATIADQVAAAVAKALADAKAATPSTPSADTLPTTGIHDPDPMKAKIAREKSKKKKVIALQRGYYGERLREEGEVFEVPVAEAAEWFEDFKGQDASNPDEELV